MIVAWHPTRLWDWCMSEYEEKDLEPIFTDKNLYQVSNIVQFLKSAVT